MKIVLKVNAPIRGLEPALTLIHFCSEEGALGLVYTREIKQINNCLKKDLSSLSVEMTYEDAGIASIFCVEMSLSFTDASDVSTRGSAEKRTMSFDVMVEVHSIMSNTTQYLFE